MIEVVKPGLQTTIQDGGRPGHLSKGIPCSGGQDSYALRMAALLVGNSVPPAPLTPGDPGDAGLEVLLRGPVLRFHRESVVAITGAETRATLDGDQLPLWESVRVPEGSIVDVGQAVRGMRSYVAVAGGIDVPAYLGSRSTYLPAGLGGLDGRALEAGDKLATGSPHRPSGEVAGRCVPDDLISGPDMSEGVRVVLGPQAHLFTDDSVAEFLSAAWKLSPMSDRMGFRFEGPHLAFKPRESHLDTAAGADPSNIVDDVTPLGGVQVPGGMEPIVMGMDFPSVGGYAKIATVISVDLGKVGQLRPGESIQFQEVSVAAAEKAASLRERVIREQTLMPSG